MVKWYFVFRIFVFGLCWFELGVFCDVVEWFVEMDLVWVDECCFELDCFWGIVIEIFLLNRLVNVVNVMLY